jgi:transcription-repair coupling factor (superfamily II helicase)
MDVPLATPAWHRLLRRLEEGGALCEASASAAAYPYLIAELRRRFPKHALIAITDGLKSQELLQQDVETWLRLAPGENPIEPGTPDKSGSKEAPVSSSNGAHLTFFYPAWDSLPHEGRLQHADIISERLETLAALAGGSVEAPLTPPLVITSIAALLQRTFTPEAMRARTRLVKRGEALDPLELIEWLETQGYEPEAQVTQKGEISLRGGILDVYPLASPWPVRLEFFGNELESLRFFNPQTQISREEIPRTVITPGGEVGILRRLLAKPDARAPAAETNLGTLFDHLSNPALVIWLDPDALSEQAARLANQAPANDPFLATPRELENSLQKRGIPALRLHDNAVDRIGVDDLGFADLDARRPLDTRAPDPEIAERQRREFFGQLHRWLRQQFQVRVFCNNDGERQRFLEIWKDYGLDQSMDAPEPGDKPDLPELCIGALTRGFVNVEAHFAVVTDAEIFGRYKVSRPRRLKSPNAVAARSALDIDFSDLEEGDYVVHIQYGIGRYLGLQHLPAVAGRRTGENHAGESQECLAIEYAPGSPDQPAPKLYVPIAEAHLVSKYVGAGKARPALNTLGGAKWAKAKAQAELAVRDLAGELLTIQAARATQLGHASKADTPWQREFESSFLYEETPDQLRAILETKADQESGKPMDRLICGDVGFGKTEVALRAAFKTVMDGRQVALLVPTTVLAQQHYNTFRERMADYPIRVERLSRQVTKRDQRKVTADLASGAVDIVIGTHRLLQEDIQFKELGLVVIDEEQRFGVLHKERFKRLRHMVDVLTLSATPIPRTLYLALMGARDMSAIETPPHDRLPVETVVTPYDERVIRDAIQRELNRQGQVFFLHNRVFTIETMAQKLKTLVPEARIVVGHGQMDANDLEKVMLQFVNGEADILLSTSIIESGLDIPNANTIIIDRADRFGLSDLYQLRGRVGRYKHQAYAYLLLPRHAGLLSDARKRIGAIKQYSSLGSGFKIAMRDLEIRGAGNLLGAEQSGHITAVGFDLYCQLLKQSVSVLKGEPVPKRIETQLRLDFLALSPQEADSATAAPKKRAPSDSIQVPREVMSYVDETVERAAEPPIPQAVACVPFAYISDARQRVEFYRKLAQASDLTALRQLRDESRDRFGPLPAPVEFLFRAAELKILASAANLNEVETRGDKLMLKRNGDYLMLQGKFPRLVKKTADGRMKEIKKIILALR